MAIYDYDNSKNHSLETIHQFGLPTSERKAGGSRSQLVQLAEQGEYQSAYDLIGAKTSEPGLKNVQAVLLMRLGKPESAANLLRGVVWDLATFTLKSNVPVHVQLNFATALFLSGHVAGCIDIIRAIQEPGAEQALELLAEIRTWEKSLSLFNWLDWKICGIEHFKNEHQLACRLPGRFDWELPVTLASAEVESNLGSTIQSHELAC